MKEKKSKNKLKGDSLNQLFQEIQLEDGWKNIVGSQSAKNRGSKLNFETKKQRKKSSSRKVFRKGFYIREQNNTSKNAREEIIAKE